jgi:tetratricopeptide (TPR) repeat protein
MRKLMAIALVACACAHAPAQQRPTAAQIKAAERQRLFELPATLLYKEGRELMAQRDWEAAQARLETFLAKQPNHPGALFDAAWVEEQLGDAHAASDLYTRALAANPGHVGAAVNLARLLAGSPDRAEAVLRAVLQRQPADPRLLNALAVALRARRQLDDAAAVVRKVLERHPRDADAYCSLAAIEADQGHLRLAEAALDHARRLDPKDARVPNSLGVLALQREDVAAARAFFEEAAQLDPDFAPAFINLGALAARYRDYAASEQAFAKAVQLDPTRWESHLARAWALEGLRRPREARVEYEKVLALAPHQDDALYGKALALKAEGDLPAALSGFKQYLGLPKASRVKEAQTQLAAIDLRLRNAPPAAARSAAKGAAGALDLSKLPQGADPGSPTEELPAEDPPSVVR